MKDKALIWIVVILVIGVILLKPDLGFLGAIVGIEEFPSELPEWEELTYKPAFGYEPASYTIIPTSLGLFCSLGGTDEPCPYGCYGKELIDDTFISGLGSSYRLPIPGIDKLLVWGNIVDRTGQLWIYDYNADINVGGTEKQRLTSPPFEYENDYFKITSSSDGWSGTVHSKLVENNIFKMDVTKEVGGYFEETSPQRFYININSKYHTEVKVILYAWIEHKTGTFGEDIKYFDLSKEILVSPGERTYDLLIPKGLVIGRYDLYVILAKPFANKINQQFPQCPAIKDAQLRLSEGVHTPFLINPKRTYFIVEEGQSCPENYVFQADSNTVCVRDDLSEIDCMQEGMECPVTIDFVYECSSAGVCVESLYWARNCQVDLDCPSNMKCETTTGVCYNVVIETQIKQCEQDLDCPSLCEGVTVLCIGGKCEYSGTCLPILVDCVDRGCPMNYECNEDDGICYPMEIPLNGDEEVEPTKIPWIYVLIGIGGFIFLLFVFKRK